MDARLSKITSGSVHCLTCTVDFEGDESEMHDPSDVDTESVGPIHEDPLPVTLADLTESSDSSDAAHIRTGTYLCNFMHAVVIRTCMSHTCTNVHSG
jgi:hypothetical protein